MSLATMLHGLILDRIQRFVTVSSFEDSEFDRSNSIGGNIESA